MAFTQSPSMSNNPAGRQGESPNLNLHKKMHYNRRWPRRRIWGEFIFTFDFSTSCWLLCFKAIKKSQDTPQNLKKKKFELKMYMRKVNKQKKWVKSKLGSLVHTRNPPRATMTTRTTLTTRTTWTTWTTRPTSPTWLTDHPDQLNHFGNPEW